MPTTPGKTPVLVRTPLPLTALQLANFQTPGSIGVSDGESTLEMEELEEVQELLAEKDEELAGNSLSANTKPLVANSEQCFQRTLYDVNAGSQGK